VDKRGIGFNSLTEDVDTGTPGGKLIFHIFGALAEFERDLIRERTNAGLAVLRRQSELLQELVAALPRRLAVGVDPHCR
jgi:DNA invertase Pin-like site-specific DNA recombinase